MEWLRTEYERAYRLIWSEQFWKRKVTEARSTHERNMAEAMVADVQAEMRTVDPDAYYPALESYAAQLRFPLLMNCLGSRLRHSENESSGTMRMLKRGWLRWQGGKLERFDLERAS